MKKIKKTYETIYPWNVLGMVKDGNVVWIIDRDDHNIRAVSEMTLAEFFEVEKFVEKEPTRFEFWREVEIETEENNG